MEFVLFAVALVLGAAAAWLGVYVAAPQGPAYLDGVPATITAADSVTVVHEGDLEDADAEKFEASVNRWREGHEVLFVPKGTSIVLTRRG